MQTSHLIIDIGSSSLRTLLMDESARVIAGSVARQPHAFTTLEEGEATADAEALRRLAERCMAETLVHPAAARLRAVGLATFVGNLLGLDAAGRPVTPVYTYADGRSAADAAPLRAAFDAELLRQRTGCPPHTAYAPARLLWLRRTQPDVWARMAALTDVGTYLVRMWSGRVDVPCSPSVASWSGLLRRETADWDAELLAYLGAPPLPPVGAGTVTLDALAERLPALRGVPCFPAVGDGAAANIGAGAHAPGVAALTVGTTAALRVVDARTMPSVPAGLWSYRVDAAHHLIGGATTEGGNVYGWARRTLQVPADAALEAALAAAAPDAHGLTLLPLLAGERSPGYALDATGALVGLRLTTTPLDIAQAALEGVALRLALIAERLGDVAEIMASGGALEHSPAWTQMFADALDRPLTLLAQDELTARGVAILLLAALDGRPWSAYPPDVVGRVAPRPTGAEALRRARARQERLYALMRSFDGG